MKRPHLALGLALAAALSGCVTANPDVVQPHQTGRLNTVQEATVVAVRAVAIDGSQSGGGAIVGAAAGTVLGSQGGPRESFIGSVVGMVAGAMIGNAIERSATREGGVELTLQMKNGGTRMIVQGQGAEVFRPGDAVIVVSDGQRARVSRAPAGAAAPVATPALPAPVYTPSGSASGGDGGTRQAPVYTPR